ncbi:hypothetical protein BDP27DRAFT_1218493 [Rhodocollybia butyracea]|uniref:Uncharacterized protein n=1 Tax=Rhodocollybia butyracea TaxID=206335 RepID=A0A9P5PYZ8_9AGAR|nr:hypothetical protein BDP27DRAFT_1218493 [Rhodocollybia butyracea]
MSPGVLSPEISDLPTFSTRQRSGTTSTTNSAFSSSTFDTFDSTFSSERSSPPVKKKRRSLGFSLGGSANAPPSTAGRGKKRKLVISGVGVEDTAAFQAVKQWCESFGEVRKFEWQQNGNLVVDWRSRSVADMVCRIQANVHIRGAGSVALSWYQS